MKKLFLKKGFTLIEILVVVTIISILSSVVFYGFNDARLEAKNKSIQAELENVQLALRLYKAQYGTYPSPPSGSIPSGCVSSVPGPPRSNSINCGTTPYIDGLVPEFISKLPDESSSGNPSCNFIYIYSSAEDGYKLYAEHCHAGAADASEGVQIEDRFSSCLSDCGGGHSFCGNLPDPIFYETYAIFNSAGHCYE